MHTVIVLGSGRSGTSMAASLFNKAGYFMGDDLSSPDLSNPKGFFESFEINIINEEILSQIRLHRQRGIKGDVFSPTRLAVIRKWLRRVPLVTSMICPDDV